MTVRKERWVEPWGTFLGAWKTKIFISEPPLFRGTFLGSPVDGGFYREIILFPDSESVWLSSWSLGLSMASRMFHLGLTTSFISSGNGSRQVSIKALCLFTVTADVFIQ